MSILHMSQWEKKEKKKNMYLKWQHNAHEWRLTEQLLQHVNRCIRIFLLQIFFFLYAEDFYIKIRYSFFLAILLKRTQSTYYKVNPSGLVLFPHYIKGEIGDKSGEKKRNKADYVSFLSLDYFSWYRHLKKYALFSYAEQKLLFSFSSDYLVIF